MNAKLTRHFSQWQRIFCGVRFRILVWYFLLVAGMTVTSILVTREIFCATLRMRATESLMQEMERFQRLEAQQTFNQTSSYQEKVAVLFNTFQANYIPTSNESVFILLKGQVYQSTHPSIADFVDKNPDLIAEWRQLNPQQSSKGENVSGQVTYVAQPITIAQETGAMIVAVYDATSSYQTNTQTIILLSKVALVILAVFSGLAWITAGRALSPVRLLEKTARSITESDMTRRIPVQGSDEIAQLTLTFNEMLDRLQLAFQTQQEFLNNASHELRTPITVIQGHLELLKYQPHKQEAIVEVVIDELNRMNRLVNDLLLLAKAERLDFLNPKPEELDWLTEELYFKARALANRNWRLESKGLSPIVIDRQRLTQAIMNLVQNAIRHTQEGDTITLGSSVHNNYAYFWVQDTGEGIAQEDRERIFERFARATNSDRYSPTEGTGLGLSIVDAITKAHSGWVELSTRLGHGSTFTMVLPLSPTVEATADESDSHRRGQSSHHRFSRSRIAGTRVHNCDR